MANKVKFGLKNVHVFPITSETAETTTYGEVIPVPGAVNLSLSPEGTSENFYADDIVYFSQFANGGYSGDLEIALVPEEFEVGILGFTRDANGNILERSDARPNNFAMVFEFDGDQKKTRHLFYKMSVARPNIASSTKTDTITPATDTLTLTALSDLQGNIRTKLSEGNKGYDTVLESVYTPAPAEEPGA